MTWTLLITKTAKKGIARLPKQDKKNIIVALDALSENPFLSGVKKLHQDTPQYRCRVGSYRILFDLYDYENVILIDDVARRTTTTYRKR